MEHEIERAVILADEGGLIEVADLSDNVVGQRSVEDTDTQLPYGRLREVMAVLEERVIRRCLNEHGETELGLPSFRNQSASAASKVGKVERGRQSTEQD